MKKSMTFLGGVMKVLPVGRYRRGKRLERNEKPLATFTRQEAARPAVNLCREDSLSHIKGGTA